MASTAKVPAARPRAFTAIELMAMEFPDVQWVIPGVLPEGLAVIAGKPKIGKSWWTLALALDIARDAPVLYLALEDTDRRLQSRFRSLLGKEAPSPLLNFHLDWPRLDQGGTEAIEKWLAANKNARLVVVDTIARVRPPRKSNEDQYLGDVDTWGPFQQLVGRYAGLTVIGVHHQRKGAADDVVDTVLGSQGLVGSVDTVMVLSRGRSKMDGELYVTGRDVEETERALSYDRGHWNDVGPLDAHRTRSERDETIGTMLELGPCLTTELAAELGISTDAAKKRLHRAKHANLVTKDGTKWVVIDREETWGSFGTVAAE